MRDLIWIGNQKILVDALERTREEKWLYLPMDELILIKEGYDKRAAAYHKYAMEATRYPFEQDYPNPAVVYDMSLGSTLVIAAIIAYKNVNCCRNYFKYGVADEKQIQQRKRKLILDLIHKNVKMTYFDVINSRGKEEALEEELEMMIDERMVSWGPQRGQYHEKFNGWTINISD